MSGGVDSSVVAWLMKSGGGECVGVTLKLFDEAGGHRSGCCSLADVNDARLVAQRIGIPHYVLNFKEAFHDEVIRPFVETYERGATPNPCIDCNRHIKFERLLRRAAELALSRAAKNIATAAEGGTGDGSPAAVLASDAFFPFPDVVEAAHAAGIKTIVQVGGSQNDTASVETADRLGIAMVLTGTRHFKH